MDRINADYFALPTDQGRRQSTVVKKTRGGSSIYRVSNLKKLLPYSFRGLDKPQHWWANAMTFSELRVLPDGSKITIITQQSYVSPGIRDAADRPSPQKATAGSDSGFQKGEASCKRPGDFLQKFDLDDLQFHPGDRAYLQALDDELSKVD